MTHPDYNNFRLNEKGRRGLPSAGSFPPTSLDTNELYSFRFLPLS
jgi:hypothetical protein